MRFDRSRWIRHKIRSVFGQYWLWQDTIPSLKWSIRVWLTPHWNLSVFHLRVSFFIQKIQLERHVFHPRCHRHCLCVSSSDFFCLFSSWKWSKSLSCAFNDHSNSTDFSFGHSDHTSDHWRWTKSWRLSSRVGQCALCNGHCWLFQWPAMLGNKKVLLRWLQSSMCFPRNFHRYFGLDVKPLDFYVHLKFQISACLQLKAALELLGVVEVNYPNCRQDGSFEPIQCRANRCWCVTITGEEIDGTVNSYGSQPNCAQPRLCPSLNCNLNCPFGYAKDQSGCPLCACRYPCSVSWTKN